MRCTFRFLRLLGLACPSILFFTPLIVQVTIQEAQAGSETVSQEPAVKEAARDYRLPKYISVDIKTPNGTLITGGRGSFELEAGLIAAVLNSRPAWKRRRIRADKPRTGTAM